MSGGDLGTVEKAREVVQQLVDALPEGGRVSPAEVVAHLTKAGLLSASSQRRARAEGFAEGYRLGVADERISESNIGIAGLGGKVAPARRNPYMAL